MRFRICPDCNANLDPGEICDCRKEEAAPAGTGTASGRRAAVGHRSTDNSVTRLHYPVKEESNVKSS